MYAWVDAFLLPEPKHLDWSTDLHDTIAKVRAEAKDGKTKPIFVDFTGETCTNCRYNENSVFPQPRVHELLDKYERVQLYTDWVPADGLLQRPRRPRAHGTKGSPTASSRSRHSAAISFLSTRSCWPTNDGKVKVLGVYDEGKINQPDRFAAWLKEGLEKAKK